MKTTVSTGYDGTRYGLGLFVWDGPCGTTYGHGGGMPGYENSFASSEDGTRQAATMMSFSAFPEAAGAAYSELTARAEAAAFAGHACRP